MKYPCKKCILRPCCNDKSKCEEMRKIGYKDFNDTGKCPDCGLQRYEYIHYSNKLDFQCINCKATFRVTKYGWEDLNYYENAHYFFVKIKRYNKKLHVYDIYNYHYGFNRMDPSTFISDNHTNSKTLRSIIQEYL